MGVWVLRLLALCVAVALKCIDMVRVSIWRPKAPQISTNASNRIWERPGACLFASCAHIARGSSARKPYGNLLGEARLSPRVVSSLPRGSLLGPSGKVSTSPWTIRWTNLFKPMAINVSKSFSISQIACPDTGFYY